MKPAYLLFVACALGAALPAFAQFGGFGDALNRARSVIDATVDVATEVATIGKAASGQFSDEEEQLLGDSVALEIVGRSGGLWRDADATRRVNLVGSALARYSERPALEWRFGLLDSDAVNAFSAPGGYVFITRGLYALAPTDDLLAGILAHEIAHITNRHALKIVGRGEALSLLSPRATEYSSSLRDAEATVAETRGEVAEISPELAEYLDVNVGQIVNLVIEKGFDAKTEYSADSDGRNLAALTGFAPGGLRAVLVTLEETRGDPDALFPTHPPLARRLRELPADPAP
jgi:predicted Zn-dependent protease